MESYLIKYFIKAYWIFSGVKTRLLPLFFYLLFAIFPNKLEIMAQNWEKQRGLMVKTQLSPRGINSKTVLEAMGMVPRHLFVPQNVRYLAYEDRPLPIGLNQTISQPYIVAYMTEQINPVKGMKVLEIGTGSGYQAAILAEIGCNVYTIELLEELALRAEKTLKDLNYINVKVLCGDGYKGWPDEAPFDAVIVTAAPEKIPQNLIDQLKDGGVMIIPVGEVNAIQYLKLITKKGNKVSESNLLPVRFVPMVEGSNK